jgi:hypothetical protein
MSTAVLRAQSLDDRSHLLFLSPAISGGVSSTRDTDTETPARTIVRSGDITMTRPPTPRRPRPVARRVLAGTGTRATASANASESAGLRLRRPPRHPRRRRPTPTTQASASPRVAVAAATCRGQSPSPQEDAGDVQREQTNVPCIYKKGSGCLLRSSNCEGKPCDEAAHEPIACSAACLPSRSRLRVCLDVLNAKDAAHPRLQGREHERDGLRAGAARSHTHVRERSADRGWIARRLRRARLGEGRVLHARTRRRARSPRAARSTTARSSKDVSDPAQPRPDARLRA